MKSALVSVTVVTHNSAPFIGRCLDAVLRQEYESLEVIVVDNFSEDETRLVLAPYRDRILLIENDSNTGFAAAQNQAIAVSRGQWILTLNPDVLLEPSFIARLVAAGGLDARAGSVCGKLLRLGRDLTVPPAARIDSTGIYFTPAVRHFDRGWNEADEGRFDQTEYVFGACAAAALYRREMIAEVSLDDGFFDPDFFTYREDADVAWRAQLLGWRCIYAPQAVAHHVRRLVNGSRHGASAILKMHSVKNRFLMRIKNMTGDLYRRNWLSATARDLLVIGGCLFYEPSSLPAFWRLAQCLPRAIAKRRRIMKRRVASDEYLAIWFHVKSRSLEPWISKAAEQPSVVENRLPGSLVTEQR
ncbi:MAG TPA: glycosyltransferase family 2 protein [Bryobacteraceae bacterium]|nr:glycosyltransferase family 2 protein [Bryobacteraceae bacterium]